MQLKFENQQNEFDMLYIYTILIYQNVCYSVTKSNLKVNKCDHDVIKGNTKIIMEKKLN